MTNEIKEILDNLDFNINHTKDWVESLGLNQDTWKLLLDYITNLQEENITLREQIRTYYKLELELNKHKYEILQQRINKAIEYINVELFNSNIDWVRNNNGCVTGSDLPGDAIFPIIDILQGE